MTGLLFSMFMLSTVAHADTLMPAEGYRALVADQRALRPGDNLTVLITESAVASTTAKTTTNKDGTVSANAAASRGGNNPYANTLAASLELAEDFKGGGTIERTGKLLARLTVVVQAVEPDGRLRVAGAQDIAVNEEQQHISVQGWVRPQDIAADNTVVSTRLSEARIEMVGRGLLAEKQRPGVLTRFLSWLGIL